MGKKLTSNERIGLLLTGILIIFVCIAMAVIPRRGAQDTPPLILPTATIPADSTKHPESAKSPSEPFERTHLNETF